MLPTVLVILAAAGTLAAPVVDVDLVAVNPNSVPQDSGNPVSGAIIDRAIITHIDEADLAVYAISAKNIVNDLGNRGDAQSQALAAAQTLNILIKLADGIPGDNCWTAALINAVAAGNDVNVALREYIDVTLLGIDHVVQLAENPRAAKFSRGVAGNCDGGGREFNLNGAWNIILNNGNRNNIDILGEEYCRVSRLYNANSVRSNNLAATITAASVPVVNEIFQIALGPVADFLRALGSSNVGAAAAVAKDAIRRATNVVC